MNEQAIAGPVRHDVVVPVPPERAYAVFSDRMGAWWPRHHTLFEESARADVVIEQRPGGRWYERDEHGVECEWGRVLELDPPRRILLAWHLDPDWEFDPDPAHASEVEVRFTPHGDGTRVELEHRAFERHGPRGAEVATSVGSDGGWPEVLGGYAKDARR